MSELLQSRKYPSDQHPDADQLNAFVEQALPEHERLETLAHLAECANCREVVALSLPPMEDAATVAPVTVTPPQSFQPQSSGLFSGWFSGWKLVGIAVPALAALVILTVHLRNPPVSQHPAAEPGQIAKSHSPASPPPTLATKPDAAPAPFAPVRPSSRTHKSRAANGGVPSIDGRDVAALKLPPPLLPNGNATEAPQLGTSNAVGGPVPVQGSMAGAARDGYSAVPSAPKSGGTAMGFLRPSYRSAPAPRAPITPTAGAPAAGQSATAQPLPAPVVNQASVASANSTTVAVNTQSAEMNLAVNGTEATMTATLVAPSVALPKSTYMPGHAPLPSGLAVLSLAAKSHQRLALDTGNQLFFSSDDGQHWKAVSAPWRTPAVKVATVAVEPTRAKTLTLAVPERYTPGATASVQPGDGAAEVLGSRSGRVSGEVTDVTGAVIPGATVVATDSHTALTRSVQTDAAGRYVVEELAPGDYRLEVRAPGFLKQSQTAVLAPSQPTVSNIVLTIGQSSQTVTVESAQTEQLQTFSCSSSLASAKARKLTVSPPTNKSKVPAVFVITTDTGDRWTSFDGRSWKPE